MASDAADPLQAYRTKRDFARTPEPAGEVAATQGDELRFVVQRHRARRLHYDFRLELDGVLVSWSVPKGPSLDPAARRLAVRVEDHPIEYLEFEGVIPAGDYGGGDVIVWDRGTWRPAEGDPAAELATGELHVDLFGEKLRGRFALVRRDEANPAARDVRTNWLLVHKRDDEAVPGWRVEDHDRSVLSGLTNDQVARAPAATWSSSAAAADAEVARSTLDESEREPVPPVTADELEALDGLGAHGTWQVAGRELDLTALDRPVLPGTGRPVTRRELLRHVALAGPHLVPFLRDRAVVRVEAGRDGPRWSHTVPRGAPDWLRSWTTPAGEGTTSRRAPVVDDIPSLLWLAGHGTVEWHPWLSRTGSPGEPTWAVIDIDPGEHTAWDETIMLARLYRTAIEHLHLVAAAKVSGRRGIHIWVPLDRGCTFDETRAWVGQLSSAVGSVVPDLVSRRWRRSERHGRARLDDTQNASGRTLVAPWSPRADAGLPVSVPITWDELDDPDLRPDRWTLRDTAERLSRPDPLLRLVGLPQHLPALDGLAT